MRWHSPAQASQDTGGTRGHAPPRRAKLLSPDPVAMAVTHAAGETRWGTRPRSAVTRLIATTERLARLSWLEGWVTG